MAAIGERWSTRAKREREAELLFIGDQFREAISRYYDSTPGAAKQFPKTLEDLLEDRRYPTVRRYLRKVFVDPLTGKPEWGLVKGPGDKIMGVYSLSPEAPLKRANFPEPYRHFETAERYTDWKFAYSDADAATQVIVAPNEPARPSAPPRGKVTPPPIPTSSVLTPAVPQLRAQPADAVRPQDRR